MDGNFGRGRVNVDFDGFDAFRGIAMFKGLDGYFVPVPVGDFDSSIDVVDEKSRRRIAETFG